MPNTTIEYLGQTTEKPMDMVTKLSKLQSKKNGFEKNLF